MKNVTILIPTYNRLTALASTLTSLISQTYTDFNVVISNQSDEQLYQHPSIQTITRILQTHGQSISFYHHLPRRGMAEQRDFLLSKSESTYSLFLDDDIILEPWVLGNLIRTLEKYKIGFVGMPVIGLSFIDDMRPDEQKIEFWNEKINSELIEPGSKKWQRHKLHNAANMYHVQNNLHLSHQSPRPYKIAWVGGCVLYDTKKLKNAGGFSFWKHLPTEHAGEDVLAQLSIIGKYGGCAILPSGVYHQELDTTVKNRKVNAPEYFAKQN